MPKFGYYQWEHKNNNFYMFLQKHIWEHPRKHILYWVSKQQYEKWRANPRLELQHEALNLKDFGRLCQKTAQKLQELGLGEGDRVLLLLPPSFQFFLSFFSLAKIACAPGVWGPEIDATTLSHTIDEWRPQAVIGLEEHFKLLRECGRESEIKHSIRVGKGESAVSAQLEKLMLGELEAETVPMIQQTTVLYHPHPDTPGEICARSAKELAAQNFALREILRPKVQDVALTPYPLTALQLMAMGVPVAIPLYAGHGLTPERAQGILAQIEGLCLNTLLIGRGPLFSLLSSIQGEKTSLPSIEKVLIDNGPLSSEQLETFQRRLPQAGLTLLSRQNDADPLLYFHLKDLSEYPSALTPPPGAKLLGELSPQLSYQLIDPQLERPVIKGLEDWERYSVPPDAYGELVVAGEHILSVKDEGPAGAQKIVDDFGITWHRTGHIVQRDAQGLFWLKP